MSDPSDLVIVYQAENVTEAHLVKNLLLDEGIEATVTDEAEPLSSLPITPVNVVARRIDELRARQIIEEYDATQEERALRADWKCPACEATVVGAFDECDVCGAVRPGTEEE